MIQCTMCEKPLSNGLDTFGDVQMPFCWDCYASLNSNEGDSWYGLAPHHHDLSITGSVIGSTVFHELPKTFMGQHDFGDRIFTPDPEAPGCGVWTRKTLPGWR